MKSLNVYEIVKGMKDFMEKVGEPLTDSQYHSMAGYLGGSIKLAQYNLASHIAMNAVLEQECDDLIKELTRVKEICLRECGVGVVNEVILAKYKII